MACVLLLPEDPILRGGLLHSDEEHQVSMMRAIGYRRYGPPEAMEELELPLPEPGPGEILMKVAAAGVNPAHWALRGGW